MSLLLERQLIILGEQDGRNVLEFFEPRTTIQYKPIRDRIRSEQCCTVTVPIICNLYYRLRWDL